MLKYSLSYFYCIYTYTYKLNDLKSLSNGKYNLYYLKVLKYLILHTNKLNLELIV